MLLGLVGQCGYYVHRFVPARFHLIDECLFFHFASLVDIFNISRRYIVVNVGVSRHSSLRAYTLRHADSAPSISRPSSMALRNHGNVTPLTCRNVVALKYPMPTSTRTTSCLVSHALIGVTLATTVPYAVFGAPITAERLMPVVQRLRFKRSMIVHFNYPFG